MHDGIVVIANNEQLFLRLRDELASRGYSVRWARHISDALEARDVDAVVLDIGEESNGVLERCRLLRQQRPELPIVALVPQGQEEAGVQAAKQGVYDFLPKPVNTERLTITLEHAIEQHRLKSEVEKLRRLAARPEGGPGTQQQVTDPDQLPSLTQVERRHIRRVLNATGGNKTKAARVLGLDRRTLYRKLERYREQQQPSPHHSGA